MTEYKFVELKALKMSDVGPGTIEGLRAVFDIDEGGDLLIKGAFRDTTPEYLNSGFSAHSHVWTFSEAVGFPIEARETDRGWWVKSQFHSTSTAQDVRTIAKERMKAGKTVGFSFGYAARDYEIIQSRDYERELPRYVSADRFDYNMAQAKRFPQIRLLKRVDVIEDSIVTAPMNKLATAANVKGRYRESADYYSRGHSLQLHLRSLHALYGPLDAKRSETDALLLRIAALKLERHCRLALNGPVRASESERLRINSVIRGAKALYAFAR